MQGRKCYTFNKNIFVNQKTYTPLLKRFADADNTYNLQFKMQVNDLSETRIQNGLNIPLTFLKQENFQEI